MRADRPISVEPVGLGSHGATQNPKPQANWPLVVDLDEVLVHPNLFIAAAFSEIAARPQSLVSIFATLLRGREALKQRIAQSTHFDPSRLHYNTEVLAFLLKALGEGRAVYLASTSYKQQSVESVAHHLGIFTGWFASDEPNNLSGDAEMQNFLQSFGAQGFDYIGSDAMKLPASSKVTHATNASGWSDSRPDWRTWAKLIRVHQYAKNALVLVPLFTAHQFAVLPASKAFLAAVAFSLCASSAYILNDLVDVTADRAHPSKRNRPLASGSVSPVHGAIAMALLLTGSIAIATSVSLAFLGVLLGYLILTTAYSFWLKRIMLADVVTLAMLYTIRVIGGAVAIDVVMSEWLLAFALFIFMSLALIKRYIELAGRLDGSISSLANRGYEVGDHTVVAVLAAAAGFNAVVVLTLYISSDAVRALYTRPQVLWLVCPILMYWVARVLMLAHRRMIDDDPVIFALKDNVSWLTMIAICVIMLLAM
jgi:4-hydroxybenzoate polyprenyltransferase